MKRHCSYLKLMMQVGWVAVFLSSVALGRGLDDLTPETSSELQVGQELTTEGSTVEGKENVIPPAVVTPSATSQKLSNKLFLVTGFGFSTLAGEKGKWSAEGVADVLAGYMTDIKLGSLKLAATYRYQPIDFTLENKGRSYRGVLEGHYVGAALHLLSTDRLSYWFSTEVGGIRAELRALDGASNESDLEKMGVNAVVGAGVDWLLVDKFKVGGRLMLGGGSYSVVQLATSASFVF